MLRLRMRTLVPLALLFALPLAAQRIDDVPHAAAVTAMAPATLAELAHAALVPAPDAVSAPPVALGFKATSNPLPGTTSGVSPADPSGAVGPQHVVGAFNNSVTVHDRGGKALAVASMTQFWHDPAFPDGLPYSPRVLYDAANDRWIMAMLNDDASLQNGVLLLAISSGADPTGTWRRYRIPLSADTRVDGDFARMVMTASTIVITVNEYLGNDLNGVDVFDIPKATAYGSATPAVTR